ncbi:hypothetical protein [Mycobacterium ostraviense]|uniref:Uncharacterized protein n=1 Tax=Mycobacterium ostraviense TaxID=2738409 RepID=A0A164BND2_9MYCO|nr:hypothetical protein [Mycobacterium ostraviense]KZS63668.1 hypothetical protein A4G28_07475 [Mycobacterium ostraviense]UGT92501.1 hypothetical protein LTS72_03555 [Mycobacterium ostraviense]
MATGTPENHPRKTSKTSGKPWDGPQQTAIEFAHADRSEVGNAPAGRHDFIGVMTNHEVAECCL